MKVLVLNNFLHPKNKEGLQEILYFLSIEYKFGDPELIHEYDIIYSPTEPIDVSRFPNKKFIFGPHFSVFPDRKLLPLLNNKNYVYIQPSEWACDIWKNITQYSINLNVFNFPVNITRFKPKEDLKRTKVSIYYKRRDPEQLEYIKAFLSSKGIVYRIFNYVTKYKEEEYLEYLQNSRFMFVLDAHESQGFALEEAMACNVPLLVWNVNTMADEYGSRYPSLTATSVPYWDERCGKIFKDKDDLPRIYEEFISKLDTYNPREYILETLTVEKCAKRFIELVESIPVTEGHDE